MARISIPGGGGGTASVNGHTGAVVLAAADVGADPAGAASAAQAVAVQRANHTGTQPASTVTGLATVATSGAYADLTAKPAIPTVGAAGAGAAVALSSTDGSVTNARTPTAHAASHASGGSDAITVASSQVTGLGTAASQPSTAFDPAGAASTAQAYAVQRANHTGTQAASTVTGLATVATSGAYTDLSGKPTITPAAIGSPAVFNVMSPTYGAVGNGVADDSTAIQAAINAAKTAGGGIIWFPAGNYLIGSTIQVYNASNIVFQGQGIFQNNVAAGPMVRFRNSNYCGTAPTLQWIGNWKANSIALELDGSLYGDFAVRGDQWPTGINVITSASATQNSAFNDLTLDVANGITGMLFQGNGTYYASNNRIGRFTWGSAGSGAPVGINFAKYADTNLCRWAYISLNVAGAIGVIYNSASPSTDQQVYECHFEELILEGYAVGTVGIKGNLTSNYGTRASYVRYRTSGSSLPSISIAGNSEIVCYDSTDGSTGYVGKRLLQAKGATGARPAPASVGVGGYYFDTTLNKPVFVNAAGTGWVDATGATV